MAGNPFYGPEKPRKSFVLCFDGTGNKFNNTPADSNILKIFRMLDAGDPNYHVYYQPGIGTYVQSQSYSHTSLFTKTYSWVQKTRDSMIGSSFDQHLMAGYKFLMRYYNQGDDIYIFGFSRGSYTARFLAEMLDMVGLLPAGNEEMARFAFKSFARWQRRLDGTEEEKKAKKEMFEFMTGFRETFSRPIRRIRFLGLFDTVNSVPRFEASFMKRSKFPYTAKSSAIVIRHAVAIDERRAKFRQDLLGETHRKHSTKHATVSRSRDGGLGSEMKQVEKHTEEIPAQIRYRRKGSLAGTRPRSQSRGRSPEAKSKTTKSLEGIKEGQSLHFTGESDTADTASVTSSILPTRARVDEDDEDENLPQDIQEVWFPGGHADIGGGWPLDDTETFPLSHTPLVWMVREAQKAGLRFVHEQMVKLKVIDDELDSTDARDYAYEPEPLDPNTSIPHLQVQSPSPSRAESAQPKANDAIPSLAGRPGAKDMRVDDTLAVAAEHGMLHDCLQFGQGTPAGGVLGWKVMEWMPFTRMDLQPDNSWRAIRWPLPRGEVRDIPESALIHTSALRRMNANPKYRPGNLIVGGGGRGVRVAPEKYGIGHWDVVREHGSPIGECMVRRRPEDENENENENGNENEKTEVNGNGSGKRSMSKKKTTK